MWVRIKPDSGPGDQVSLEATPLPGSDRVHIGRSEHRFRPYVEPAGDSGAVPPAVPRRAIRYDRALDVHNEATAMRKTALGLASAALSGLLAINVLAAPAVGDAAPDFRLQDQNNEWHALADFSGKWVVLYFYPKADTPGCTTEACEFRDNIFAYEDMGAAVIGVSLDDVESQAAFAEKYSLPFPLLSDAQQVVAERYGVLTSFGAMTVANRETFLINPEGKIAKHYASVDPAAHSAEVLADLKALM
jgi:peroxiredoxin Q/BCP